jgi:hypothetical protein
MKGNFQNVTLAVWYRSLYTGANFNVLGAGMDLSVVTTKYAARPEIGVLFTTGKVLSSPWLSYSSRDLFNGYQEFLSPGQSDWRASLTLTST